MASEDHLATIKSAVRLEVSLVGGSLQMDMVMKHANAMAADLHALRAYVRHLEAEHRRIGDELGEAYDGFDATDQVIAEWRAEYGVTPAMLGEEADPDLP